MGWNQLRIKIAGAAARGPGEVPRFISCIPITWCPKDPDLFATETDYPTPFTSAIWRENVFATQFHPEKSQRMGLAMLHNFAAIR